VAEPDILEPWNAPVETFEHAANDGAGELRQHEPFARGFRQAGVNVSELLAIVADARPAAGAVPKSTVLTMADAPPELRTLNAPCPATKHLR